MATSVTTMLGPAGAARRQRDLEVGERRQRHGPGARRDRVSLRERGHRRQAAQPHEAVARAPRRAGRRGWEAAAWLAGSAVIVGGT